MPRLLTLLALLALAACGPAPGSSPPDDGARLARGTALPPPGMAPPQR